MHGKHTKAQLGFHSAVPSPTPCKGCSAHWITAHSVWEATHQRNCVYLKSFACFISLYWSLNFYIYFQPNLAHESVYKNPTCFWALSYLNWQLLYSFWVFLKKYKHSLNGKSPRSCTDSLTKSQKRIKSRPKPAESRADQESGSSRSGHNNPEAIISQEEPSPK